MKAPKAVPPFFEAEFVLERGGVWGVRMCKIGHFWRLLMAL